MPANQSAPPDEVTLGIKIGLIVVAVAVALWLALPLDESITLGLDLRGGTHMEIEVDLEDAVRAQGERTLTQVREELEKSGLTVTAARQEQPGRLFLEGLQDRGKAEEVVEQFASWEPRWDGDTLRLSLRSTVEEQVREGASQQVRETIERRIDQFGVSEPLITRSGADGERIVLQLPGLDDAERAKRIITTSSQMEFRLGRGQASSREELLSQFDGALPEDVEVVQGTDTEGSRYAGQWYALQKASVNRGEDLIDVRVTSDEFGKPAIGFTFSPDGGRRFGAFTSEHVGDPLAVVLDDHVVQYATIQSTIHSTGVITGAFSLQDVQDSVLTLKSGALPAKVRILFEQTVGPALGKESIRAGTSAMLAGFLTVVVFMLVWYRLAGINAVMALLLNLVLVLAGLSLFGATLTLPGIAGLILTVGMAVDANVIIFERIREELGQGKTPRSAVDSGFDKALSSILDANVTTLLAAFFLYNFGTGPIKGFAVTLGLGIVASLFTAIFVSRTLFEIYFRVRPSLRSLAVGWGAPKERRIPYMRLRPVAVVVSGILVLGGIGVWATRGLNYGIDFTGGTQVVVKGHEGANAEELRNRLAGTEFANAAIQRFGDPSASEFLLRLEGAEQAVGTATVNAPGEEAERESAASRLIGILTGREDERVDLNAAGRDRLAGLLEQEAGISSGEALSAADAIVDLRSDPDHGPIRSVDEMAQLGLPSAAVSWLQENARAADFAVIKTESVGPAVGAELRSAATSAVVWSLAVILAYIWFRFELRFGVAAIAALAHDVLVTIGVFALVGKEINIYMIAALLTIVGYSLNDTIVVFDRVRENLSAMKRESFLEILDRSLSQTLSRTLLTSGTTLIVVLSLLIWGGPVLGGFSLALTVGVLIGTYSSIFVASPILLLWERRAARRRRAREAA